MSHILRMLVCFSTDTNINKNSAKRFVEQIEHFMNRCFLLKNAVFDCEFHSPANTKITLSH